MRSWHTAAGFGAMQGMDLQRGATRTLVEEAWVAGSLAVGAWSTPAAPLENPGTLLVNSGYGLTKPSCPLSRQAVLTYGTGLNQQSQHLVYLSRYWVAGAKLSIS